MKDRRQKTEGTPVKHPGREPGSTGQGGLKAEVEKSRRLEDRKLRRAKTFTHFSSRLFWVNLGRRANEGKWKTAKGRQDAG